MTHIQNRVKTLKRSVEKYKITEDERTKKDIEVVMHQKAVRIINLGIVDINNIIRMYADARSQEDTYHLSVYLMEMIPYFKENPQYHSVDLVKVISEMLECKEFKQGEVLFREGDHFANAYINIQGKLARIKAAPADESEELEEHGEYPEHSVIG